jgi:hypothetical protein
LVCNKNEASLVRTPFLLLSLEMMSNNEFAPEWLPNP